MSTSTRQIVRSYLIQNAFAPVQRYVELVLKSSSDSPTDINNYDLFYLHTKSSDMLRFNFLDMSYFTIDGGEQNIFGLNYMRTSGQTTYQYSIPGVSYTPCVGGSASGDLYGATSIAVWKGQVYIGGYIHHTTQCDSIVMVLKKFSISPTGHTEHWTYVQSESEVSKGSSYAFFSIDHLQVDYVNDRIIGLSSPRKLGSPFDFEELDEFVLHLISTGTTEPIVRSIWFETLNSYYFVPSRILFESSNNMMHLVFHTDCRVYTISFTDRFQSTS